MHALSIISFSLSLVAFPLALATPNPILNARVAESTSCPHGTKYVLKHTPFGPRQGNGTYAYLSNSGSSLDNAPVYEINFGVNETSQAAEFTFKQASNGACFLSFPSSAAIPNATEYRAGVLTLSGYDGDIDGNDYLTMFPPGKVHNGRQIHANCGITAQSFLNCSAMSTSYLHGKQLETVNILDIYYGVLGLASCCYNAYKPLNITLVPV